MILETPAETFIINTQWTMSRHTVSACCDRRTFTNDERFCRKCVRRWMWAFAWLKQALWAQEETTPEEWFSTETPSDDDLSYYDI